LPTRHVTLPRVDVRLTLGPLRRIAGDPTTRARLDGWWRASRTPEGPATIRLRAAHDGTATRVEAEAWGEGAEHALDAVPALLGADDDPAALVPQDDVVADLVRRLPGLRLLATGTLMEHLPALVLEQKVTGLEARRAWWALVRRVSEPAPGPAGLLLPPAPEALAAMAYTDFHRLGVERRRAQTIIRTAKAAGRVERIARTDPVTARRLLQELPGIGPWTAAWATLLGFGDPDAVIVGDYHLPHLTAWAYTGRRRGSDEEMLELLAPYAGQRMRVLRLIVAGGRAPPRRGPRLAPRDFAAS
jgi:3-methyladenine DNA glycosylase/8-oxoguanine DNA glycosylase